jgi:prolyl 4-hydroxylase
MYKTSINSTAGVMEINGTEINSKFRNANVNTDYYYKNSKVKNLIEKICKKINLPYKNLETPQIIEYPVGGYYLPHFDAFHNNLKNIDEIIKKIGNRKYTCIIYLNDNFIGGETVFPELNETIKPKTGNGLYFENIDNNGKILKTSLHAGLPVTEGIKYIIPLWFRENSY